MTKKTKGKAFKIHTSKGLLKVNIKYLHFTKSNVFGYSKYADIIISDEARKILIEETYISNKDNSHIGIGFGLRPTHIIDTDKDCI